MTKPEIQTRIASRLKANRSSKGLSLDAVAQLSGVSRSMVSQIERGESSPTVATLWNLTQALGMDLAGVLDADDSRPAIAVVREGQAPQMDGLGEGCRIRILSAPEDVGRQEIYDIAFEANGVLDSDGHGAGVREHLIVMEGALDVDAQGAEEQISAGDSARYAVDGPHVLRATQGPARAILIVEFR